MAVKTQEKIDRKKPFVIKLQELLSKDTAPSCAFNLPERVEPGRVTRDMPLTLRKRGLSGRGFLAGI